MTTTTEDTMTTYPTHSTTYDNGLTIENYASRPTSGSDARGRVRNEWPTGFAGTGWLVRRDTVILFADAFRSEALQFAGVEVAR